MGAWTRLAPAAQGQLRVRIIAVFADIPSSIRDFARSGCLASLGAMYLTLLFPFHCRDRWLVKLRPGSVGGVDAAGARRSRAVAC